MDITSGLNSDKEIIQLRLLDMDILILNATRQVLRYMEYKKVIQKELKALKRGPCNPVEYDGERISK